MSTTASRWTKSTLTALAIAGILCIAPAGFARGTTGATVEVTIVHAFATTPRGATGTANPGAPELDVFLDGQQVASGLSLGGAVVLASRLAVGPHLLQIALPGEPEFLQEQSIAIPDAAAVDLAIGYSPAGGAGLPYASVFANDFSPIPQDSTALVLRNVSDDPAVSLHLFAASTPDELKGVLRGEAGAATVPVGFTEMRLIPTNCAADCSVLFQQDFPAGARTIVYAVGRTGDTFDTSSFDAVNRILAQETGSLTISKAFDPQQSGSAAVFTIDVTCDAAAYSQTLRLSAGQSATIPGIPAGTSCTVSEPELPAAPAGWTWGEALIEPAGGAVSVPAAAAASVTVTNRISPVPAIDLVKQADAAGFFQAGDLIRYTLITTNTGRVALTGVRVSDPLPGLSPLTCGSGDLAPGESMTCVASYRVSDADTAAGLVRNTATVVGSDATGATVSDSATVAVARQLVATGSGAPLAAAATALALICCGLGLRGLASRRIVE